MQITLNGTTLKTAKNINQIIDFTDKAVMDEVRGYLVFKNLNWVFVGPAQINTNIKFKKLVLSLESPHKDEFDSYNNPLRPANGKTGTNINSKITKRNFINNLNKKSIYEVFIMNPIQYQASCYCVLKNNYSRDNTNQVFRILFSKKGFNLRSDYINRIKNYNPDYIINCCTYSLKKVVSNAIKETGISNTTIFEDKHPSFWK